MHRFFVEKKLIEAEMLCLGYEESHHMLDVMRIKPGTKIEAFDGCGSAYIVSVGAKNVAGMAECEICETMTYDRPGVDIWVGLAVTKGEKFEYALQKLTELGVMKIVPLLTRNTVRQGLSDNARKRWERIVREAVRQSHSYWLPEFQPVTEFEQAVAGLSGAGLKLIAHEKEGETSMHSAYASYGRDSAIALLVGPEGGFADAEIDFSQSCGFRPISLGNRILRSETAAVAMATVAAYEIGLLGE